ncbi:MAG: hypothetical protein ACETVO_04090 [bacterium]
MEIRVEEVKGFDTNEQKIIIEECIKETLNNHPFLERLTKPGLVRIWVKMGPEEKTRVNHRLFSEWCVVILYLWEEDIRPHYPGGAREVDELDREKIDKVLSHEFGHFIDAKVNTEKFGYNDREYECQPYRNIYNILWCSYIDGRLKKHALFSLKDRMEEGRSCIRINSEHIRIKSVFIEKAWNKEFTTHKEFLYGAEEAYKESKKESDEKKANI